MGVIEFKEVSKRFGKNTVLDMLDLNIAKGEIYGLVGPSGCGKSTLMKILLGIYSPDSGQILINGEDVSKDRKRIRKLVGYTTQENSFYEKLTVLENMKYYADLYGTSRKHLEDLLKDVQLLKARNTLAGSISGGMKRRLDFAISLIHDPEILVLDEPTTGLDPILVKQFWEIVAKTKGKGRTIVVSSHIFSELEDNCSKVGIMFSGRIRHTIDLDNMRDKKELIRIFPLFERYAVQR